MKLIDKFIYLNTNKVANKAIKRVLIEKLQRENIMDISTKIWNDFKKRSINIKKKETFGADVMVKLSLLTLIIYENLIERNFNKQEAIELTSKINWIVYEKLTNRFWIFTRIFSKRPIFRVKKAMDFFINIFPYKSPGYEMEILSTENNVVVFNVHKCPAAEFFKEHNLSELCVDSWCNLDYALAEKWNVTLERDKTIAKGNELCNFKFTE